jgi:hypothetical protein
MVGAGEGCSSAPAGFNLHATTKVVANDQYCRFTLLRLHWLRALTNC